MQELFQLLMRELFDADFGMFTLDPVSRTYYSVSMMQNVKRLYLMQELFQLLMRELFDADFGMFTLDPVSRTHHCIT